MTDIAYLCHNCGSVHEVELVRENLVLDLCAAGSFELSGQRGMGYSHHPCLAWGRRRVQGRPRPYLIALSLAGQQRVAAMRADGPGGPSAGSRAGPPKLDDPRLAAAVNAQLAGWWSPQQIAARLRIARPSDPMMRVSHETIYQGLYVQGRGELRRELARCLRTGRATRRPRRPGDDRGKIPGKIMISERPAEAADRPCPATGKAT